MHEKLAQPQHHPYLPPSLLPQANIIVGLDPGEVFVQRNVGNQVRMWWCGVRYAGRHLHGGRSMCVLHSVSS
jgi:hypothetical protein